MLGQEATVGSCTVRVAPSQTEGLCSLSEQLRFHRPDSAHLDTTLRQTQFAAGSGQASQGAGPSTSTGGAAFSQDGEGTRTVSRATLRMGGEGFHALQTTQRVGGPDALFRRERPRGDRVFEFWLAGLSHSWAEAGITGAVLRGKCPSRQANDSCIISLEPCSHVVPCTGQLATRARRARRAIGATKSQALQQPATAISQPAAVNPYLHSASTLHIAHRTSYIYLARSLCSIGFLHCALSSISHRHTCCINSLTWMQAHASI